VSWIGESRQWIVTTAATDMITGDTSVLSAGFNASADGSVAKAAEPAQVFVGENLTYTIAVTNKCPKGQRLDAARSL
jgi:hypothetical protein